METVKGSAVFGKEWQGGVREQDAGRSRSAFQGSGATLYDTVTVDTDSTHLSKSVVHRQDRTPK